MLLVGKAFLSGQASGTGSQRMATEKVVYPLLAL